MACKEGKFDVVELMVNDLKTYSNNLNAQHVNGMTPFQKKKKKSINLNAKHVNGMTPI